MPIETNAIEFISKVREYADIFGPRHGKNLGQIVKERALKLAYELYKQTADVAPTPADIARDVVRQGWRIPKKFPDGRLGRGTPNQWLSTAVNSLPKKRGRKTKARKAEEESILSSKPTLSQMQAFVIKWRSAHTKFVASGWLGAIYDLGGHPNQRVDPSRGSAQFSEDFSGLSGEVDLINSTPGISEVNAKHGIVQKAIDAQISDMATYISDHISQELKAA